MKYIFFAIILTTSQAVAQKKKTIISVFPRLGHDFIIRTSNTDFSKGGRYVFEKIGQDNLTAPSNWYAGIGIEAYIPTTRIQFAFDALFIDRTIDYMLPNVTNTYNARALKGKGLIKCRLGGEYNSPNRFYIALGGSYTDNVSEKHYENGIAKQNFVTNTSGGASAITGIAYEWEPSTSVSAINTSDTVISIGVYYNRDLFSFVNSSPDVKLSYINISLNLKGVVSLLMRNPGQ
jgi:hypothetical protein